MDQALESQILSGSIFMSFGYQVIDLQNSRETQTAFFSVMETNHELVHLEKILLRKQEKYRKYQTLENFTKQLN